jgi:predicted DNA-binding protein
MPKPKKPGRPKLPKGEAKGGKVQVRLSPEEQKRLETVAKNSGQTISQWLRSTINAAIGG